MTTNTVITIFAAVGVVSGALIGIRQLVQPYRERLENFVEWFEEFKRDWSGEEESPGRSRVPGVMERLQKLDGELSNNGGSTIKDKVDELYSNQALIMEAFVEMGERLIAIEGLLADDSEVKDTDK